ncbi:hypothetical protein Acr_00g0040420 [Actinidia rufa]|uniref:Uncharacterized protein n=1 Tax=Actinidia rufa TaxID=165716 RepID=A0A7J0DIX0_9ERIC|nr:hypothetical protein Acr_00g0040420 [Actinidia rufa]
MPTPLSAYGLQVYEHDSVVYFFPYRYRELMRREIGKRRGGGSISVVLVVLVGLLGLLAGYLMKKP